MGRRGSMIRKQWRGNYVRMLLGRKAAGQLKAPPPRVDPRFLPQATVIDCTTMIIGSAGQRILLSVKLITATGLREIQHQSG